MVDLVEITRKSQIAKLKSGNTNLNHGKSENGNFGIQNPVLQKFKADKRSLYKRALSQLG